MSFQTSIYGNAPANTFVYTTTTVSVDNISVENLSATNATISVLKTDLFNPINVNATNIECTNLTVLDTGNFSEINTKQIHVSNISLDGTIGGHTANFITVNADHSVTDALYLNETTAVLTEKSLIKRDANNVMFIGRNVSDSNQVTYEFYTNNGTGAPKLKINRDTNIVEVLHLDVDGALEAGTGTFNEVIADDLTVTDTTTLNTLEVQTSASIANLNVIGANGLTATKGRIINFSSTNASIANLSVTGGMNAAGTSRFNYLTVDYFQSYLTAQCEDLTSNTGNISVFGSTNISNNALLKTINLSAVNASISNDLRVGNNINCDRLDAVTVIVAPEISAPIVNAGQLLNASTILAKLVNTSNLSAINASVDNALNVRFAVRCGSVNASTTVTAPQLNSTNISTTNISAAKITGDVSQNLSAGFGIALTTIGGVTTIANTGGSVTDPLNLSTLNASTINVSLLNADNIEGFTKSTEYAFRSTSDAEDVGSPIVTIGLAKIPFNERSAPPPQLPWEPFCVPDELAYNKPLYEYTVPVAGIWQFGWQVYVENAPTTQSRLSLVIDGVEVISVGGYVGNIEAAQFVGYVNAGAVVYVKNANATITLNLSRKYSFWYGYKLTPANNLITSTTNLSIQNLSVADDMSATTIKSTNALITTLQPTNFTMPNVTDTFNVSGICNFSNLIRCGVLQGLNISAPIIRAPNMYTSNISATTLDRCLTANISFVNASNVSSITINTSKINGRVGDFEIAVVANEITGSHFYGNNISMTQSITCSNLNASQTITANQLIANNGFSAPSGSIPNFTTTDLTINDKVTPGQAEFERANDLLNIYGDKTSSPDIIITPASSRVTMTNISSSYLTGINASLNSMTVNTSAKINVINSSQLNVSNISANAVTINSLTAYTSESEYVYFTNNAFGAPGTADAQPAILFKNGPVFEIRAGAPAFPGNINFTRDGTTTNMIYDGNLNISSRANISNISATNLTLTTALTGAGNINITGDIQTTGIINGTTLTGDIAGNLSAGTGIVLTTAAGVTNISNSAPYQLPVGRVYARIVQTPEAPSTGSLLYYTTFDTLTLNSPHVNFVTPNINSGGANTGFIIQTAGTYKITFTQCVHSVSYSNRVNWWTRLAVNGTPQFCATFIYTRSDNSQYGQYGSSSTSQILILDVGDYLQLVTLVAKNTPAFNNNWAGLEGYSGSSFIIELLS